MYTTGDVCKILNVSRPTLYKLCKERSVHPKKTSGNFRFSETDLKKILQENGKDLRDVEERFLDLVKDTWLIMRQMAKEVWGVNEGEKKLVDFLQKNKDDLFILNVSSLKENVYVNSRDK